MSFYPSFITRRLFSVIMYGRFPCKNNIMARLFVLFLFTFFAGSAAFGATITVVLEGIEGELLENVRNTLSIEQY